jgi:hypothetical protein
VSLFRWRAASRTGDDVRRSAVFPDALGSSWQFLTATIKKAKRFWFAGESAKS